MPTNCELPALIAKYKQHPHFAEIDLTDINRQCYPDDDTLLHLVARVGGVDEVSLLVTSGADVNARGDMGRTPLHSGAARGRLDVVETLLELGADPSLRDEFGDTPLTVALRVGHVDVTRFLTRAGKTNRLRGGASAGA